MTNCAARPEDPVNRGFFGRTGLFSDSSTRLRVTLVYSDRDEDSACPAAAICALKTIFPAVPDPGRPAENRKGPPRKRPRGVRESRPSASPTAGPTRSTRTMAARREATGLLRPRRRAEQRHPAPDQDPPWTCRPTTFPTSSPSGATTRTCASSWTTTSSSTSRSSSTPRRSCGRRTSWRRALAATELDGKNWAIPYERFFGIFIANKRLLDEVRPSPPPHDGGRVAAMAGVLRPRGIVPLTMGSYLGDPGHLLFTALAYQTPGARTDTEAMRCCR